MPKTYETPDPKQEPGKESKERKTVGVYGRPERAVSSRGMNIAIAVIVAIVILFLLYRVARGEGPYQAALAYCPYPMATSLLHNPVVA